MKALLEGLMVVFKHLFKRPVTLEYPEKKRNGDNFRGKPVMNGCVGCGICKKVCPSGAIRYKKDEYGRVEYYTIDLEKCIFCGNCMYYCPKHAIKLTQDFELGSADKKDLKLNFKRRIDDN